MEQDTIENVSYPVNKLKNKFLLIPFMLIMVLLQVFLSITLFILGMACLSGDPVIFISMVLITILISVTCWILRTVKLFYDEICSWSIVTGATRSTATGCVSNNLRVSILSLFVAISNQSLRFILSNKAERLSRSEL